MDELIFTVVNGADQRPKGTCKQCFDHVFLNESVREFRDGTVHIEGSCAKCGLVNKLIPFNESLLYKKMKEEGTLEKNGFKNV